MSLYVCALLYNEPDPAKMLSIPSGSDYHVLRFGYDAISSEEQTDQWGMHSPDNHLDGHIVSDWKTDDYSSLIYPYLNGYGRMYAMVQWSGADFKSRDRFVRDPLGLTANPMDTTNCQDRTDRFNSKCWEVYVRPETPLAIQVRNMSGSTQRIRHAQFKLYITPEEDVARM